MVAIQHLHDGRGHRNTPLLFNFHPVGSGVSSRLTRFNATRNLNGSCIEQQFFGKRSLASIWVRDDGEATTSQYFCTWGAGDNSFDGDSALI